VNVPPPGARRPRATQNHQKREVYGPDSNRLMVGKPGRFVDISGYRLGNVASPTRTWNNAGFPATEWKAILIAHWAPELAMYP
jgi:hypothetical protein